MTYIPNTINQISVVNSSSAPLGGGAVFLGSSEDVTKYTTISVSVVSDAVSAATGVVLESSPDNTNWAPIKSESYSTPSSVAIVTANIEQKYFRVRYTNGATPQTLFILQTKFETAFATESKVIDTESDSFGRQRTSEPFTLLSANVVEDNNSLLIYDKVTGAATSVHDTNSSMVTMATTGVGSVMRRSRSRAIYQPGKSLLIYMTGVLNSGANASTVTTRIGYYDDDGGYYFQHLNGVISIVERTSVTGGFIETVVPQSSWNINQIPELDGSKTNIYWFSMEWLGVGFVDAGIIKDGKYVVAHRFRNGNVKTTPYIQTASLLPTYEIVSTGGAGSMGQICYTVISEGGYTPIGNSFSINMGVTTRTISSVAYPIISLRIKDLSKKSIALGRLSIISTTGANTLVEILKFNNTAASSVLDNLTFADADAANSVVEYNTSATSILSTTGSTVIASAYFSNNNDSINIERPPNSTLSVVDSVSDLLVVCVRKIGTGTEEVIASISWFEYI